MADLNYVSPTTADLVDYYTKEQIDDKRIQDAMTYAKKTELADKQDALIAGQNIHINGRVISADASSIGDYEELDNKPKINGVELVGNKSLHSLGIDIPEVPTNVSAFTNDAGYLTEHQDISGKANITYVDSEVSIVRNMIPDVSGKADKTYVDTEIADVRGDIPSIAGLASETYVNGKVAEVRAEIPDVSGKADKSYVDAEIASVEAEIPSLEGYATETYVNSQGFLKEHQSLAGLATESWVEAKGYLTEHQSLSDYALVSETGN